jgi:hypothetical protein
MPRRLDRDKQQLSLFPTDLRHLAESIGLDWWAAKKLYDDKWLSFDPEINTTDSSSKEAEFIFLGTLVAAGCDPHMLKRLLETLEKPYCYGLSGMYYDWEKRCWMDHDLPSQTAAKIVSEFEDEGDAASLTELKERVQEAINRLNGDEGALDAITGASTGNSEASKQTVNYPAMESLVIQGLDRFLSGKVTRGVARGDLFLQVRLFLEDHSGPMVKALADLEWDLQHPPLSEKSKEEQDSYMVDNMSDLIWQAAPWELRETWYEMMEGPGDEKEIEIS